MPSLLDLSVQNLAKKRALASQGADGIGWSL